MKKLLLPLIIIIILAGIVGVFTLDSIVQTGIEKHGSRIAGTDITVGTANISPFTGKASLKNMVVENPKGFNSPNAFVFEDLVIYVDISSILSDVLVVKELRINAPEITYELSFSGGNMAKLKENIRSYGNKNAASSGESSTDGSVASSGKKVKQKVIIEKVLITNAKVTYGETLSGQTQMETLALPDIHVEDIGVNENGVGMDEASAIILQHVMQELGKLDSGSIKRQIDGLGQKIKNLFD